MKLIDQNDHPITDPSTLPAVEAATQMAIAIDEANAFIVEEPFGSPAVQAKLQKALLDPPDPLRITHGKNGVPELPAIHGTTTSAADLTPEQITISAKMRAEEKAFDRELARECAEHGISTDDEAADSKLSRRDYMAAKLERMGLRLVAYAADTAGYPVRNNLLGISQLLAAIVEDVREMPADWKPAKKGQKTSNEIAVGDIVKVRGKAAAIYADAISPAELEHLTVLRVGKLLRCETTSKVLVIINAHHVTKA